jgi:hypothetical protein
MKNLYGYKYELVKAEDTFRGLDNPTNDGLVFGINWLDEDGEITDCEWYKTEADRQRVVAQLAWELKNIAGKESLDIQ